MEVLANEGMFTDHRTVDTCWQKVNIAAFQDMLNILIHYDHVYWFSVLLKT